MMSIKQILESRKQEQIGRDLYKLTSDIESFAEGHLKRVLQVLTEFDIHDISHSRKVIENIELILGDEILNSLSSFELFFLLTSSYLHDCAMAPAEWELNLMKMTEGSDKYFDNESSVKNDLKQPYSYQQALTFIDDLWVELKVDLSWDFCPDSENELKRELASLLIEYQKFRNGFKDSFEYVKSQGDFSKLNDQIRIDFIRCNHHIRIEKYVKNLSRKFGEVIGQPAWGKKITNDLSSICRSHGENLEYIFKLDKESQYVEAKSTNLQFVSMMLRLGDIIHYSFDRAPMSISKAKVFESNYSFHEWAVKNNGVSYEISNGRISFKAYCTNPNDYFKLHKYLDYIDQEIQNYFTLSRQWQDLYKFSLEEIVNRHGIKNDEDEFLPVRGLKFKINQKQIIELLMGVGLYKDEYACLRELYQNALDACRTLKATHDKNRYKKEFEIEFGLEKIDDDMYLYCRDNGVGMNEDIIENYLLNIGNSYYKSPVFYREQANYSSDFTPTSQFGIGILSCFMLGERIDIVTKKENRKLISCSIEGPHETFYYRKNDIVDEELIGESGTIIRVLLKNEFKSKISDRSIDNIDLIKITKRNSFEYKYLPEKYNDYRGIIDDLDDHLYFKVDDFVTSTFEDIKVYVKTVDSGCRLSIHNKPYAFDYKKLNLLNHKDYINALLIKSATKNDFVYSDFIDSVNHYNLKVEYQGIIINVVICLPKKELSINSSRFLNDIPVIGFQQVSIDGISVDSNSFHFDSPIYGLARIGSLNFTGKVRPQLSVDRKSITSVPKELDSYCDNILDSLIDLVLDQLEDHLKLEGISHGTNLFNECVSYAFDLFNFKNDIFFPKFLSRKLSKLSWDGFSGITLKEKSIKEFLLSDYEIISHPNKSGMDYVSKTIINSKIINSDSVTVNKDEVIIKSSLQNGSSMKLMLHTTDSDRENREILFPTSNWNVENPEYDIVTSVLPCISNNLYDCICSDFFGEKREKYITIAKYSNGLGAFFKQDPLLVHHNMGLYLEDNHGFNKPKKSNVYSFNKHRSEFHLSEVNDYEPNNKTRIMVYVFISPRKMENHDIDRLYTFVTSDPEYVNGVNNGWSVLMTGMKEYNMVIKPGVNSRDELLKMIPDEFWKEYSEYNFQFCDGSPANPLP
ncbi:HD domain-containing protein [Photobacterium sanguinicancri]|nr:ATP-binding protein [Photobacterium sanguinicancri]